MSRTVRARLRAARAAGALAFALTAASAGSTRAETGGAVLVDAAAGVDRVNVGSYEKRSDGTLLWPKRYFGISAAMDWSPYDFVEVTLFNPGARSIPFGFEVKDAESRDYWTRVNRPQVLGPGLQTIRLPTRLRVGETGRPGRPLDAARVVSLILARSDEGDRAPIEIRRIELKKSSGPSAPGALAFHVGPADAGVPDGFLSLNETTSYAPERGWGWLAHEFWAPYPQVNREVAPDELTSSNLTIASARLRVDLKPGNYRVWMIIDHPGGFWGEYPYYRRRTVKAQGRLVLDERLTAEKSKAAYFRWQDAEDREGDDLYDRYWSNILKEKTFDVRVDGGHLDLDFQNEGCPGRLPCFGLALSALAVFPIDTPAQTARATAWLAQERESRRAEFLGQHLLKEKSLTRLLDGLPAGLGVWDVSPDLDLSRARPDDLRPLAGSASAAPRITAFRNARAYFAPAVSWKGSGARALSWRVEGLPADVPAEGGWIKFRALRDPGAESLYAVRERWVTDERRRAFAPNDLGRLWLRFPVSRDARPGLYRATLVVSAAGEPRDVRVPFELRVLKARAADLDFPVGPFNDSIAENWWDAAPLRPRRERLEKESLAKLRALGFTAFSFSPRLRVSAHGDDVSVDAREVDRVMAAAKSAGFLGLVGYDDVFLGENLCATPGPDTALSGAGRLGKIADALEAASAAGRWLPLALVVCDEPVGDRVAELSRRLDDLPPMNASRRVQWSVTTSLGRYAGPEVRRLVRQVSLPFLSAFSPSEISFPWAYYNDASRQTLGLGMYRLRRTTDLRDRLLWTWNESVSNPYFDFDGRESDYAWCASTADERLRCSVELDRVVDRGLTDYRIALGLRKLLEERKDLSPEKRAQGLGLLEQAEAPGTDPDAWLRMAGEFEERL
jgi:hypothetical protein